MENGIVPLPPFSPSPLLPVPSSFLNSHHRCRPPLRCHLSKSSDRRQLISARQSLVIGKLSRSSLTELRRRIRVYESRHLDSNGDLLRFGRDPPSFSI